MISTTTNRITYTGDGATTAFPYTFLILANTDLQVIETTIATGVQTLKTLTTDYTVSGVGTGSGTVTAVVAPANTVTWTLARAMPRTQTTDYVEGDKFPASTHELALDKLTMIAQEIDTAMIRTLRQPTGDTADIGQLPAKAVRASKFLGFDAEGNPLATSVTSPGVVSAFMLTVLDDATAAAAATTFGVLPVSGGTITGGINSTATTYFQLPQGTTAQRPGSPNSGMTRYNSTTQKFEGYGTAWGMLGGGAQGAGVDAVFYENDQAVTGNYSITSGKNAMSAGPITINSGVTVTVPAGSTWTVV